MTEDELKAVLSSELAGFYGQLVAHVDRRIDELQAHVDTRLDRVQISLDREAKQVEIDEHERAAMSSQLDRHQGWITQLADSSGTKLAPEP